jgi:hypothetical protein
MLKPRGGPFRLINIGRKRVPDIDGHERNWGFVDTVARSGKEIEEALRRETYETKTRGPRLRPAAAPGGRGRLRPGARRQKDLPGLGAGAAGAAGHGAGGLRHSRGGEPRDLDQEPGEGRWAAGRAAPDERTPEDPGELQEVFRDRRFAGEDPRLLDFAGAQIVFVGAREGGTHDVDLHPQEESPQSADIFKALRFARSRHPVEPLLQGEWR